MSSTVIKYRKKGTMERKGAKELFLTDEERKSYPVDEAVAMVWDMCDGIKTVDEIAGELAGKTKIEKTEVKEAVMRAVAQLERFGLLKRV